MGIERTGQVSVSGTLPVLYGPCTGFVLSNDGTSDITFTLNSMTIIVKAGEVFEGVFNPYTSVVINTTGVPYRYLMIK